MRSGNFFGIQAGEAKAGIGCTVRERGWARADVFLPSSASRAVCIDFLLFVPSFRDAALLMMRPSFKFTGTGVISKSSVYILYMCSNYYYICVLIQA